MFLLAYYITVLPMSSRINNFIQIFNEVVVTLAIVTIFLFTDYVEDPELRYEFGKYFIDIFFLNLIINLLVLITSFVLFLRRKLKQYWLLR